MKVSEIYQNKLRFCGASSIFDLELRHPTHPTNSYISAHLWSSATAPEKLTSQFVEPRSTRMRWLGEIRWNLRSN